MRVRKETQGLGHSSMTVPAEIIRSVGSKALEPLKFRKSQSRIAFLRFPIAPYMPNARLNDITFNTLYLFKKPS